MAEVQDASGQFIRKTSNKRPREKKQWRNFDSHQEAINVSLQPTVQQNITSTQFSQRPLDFREALLRPIPRVGLVPFPQQQHVVKMTSSSPLQIVERPACPMASPRQSMASPPKPSTSSPQQPKTSPRQPIVYQQQPMTYQPRQMAIPSYQPQQVTVPLELMTNQLRQVTLPPQAMTYHPVTSPPQPMRYQPRPMTPTTRPIASQWQSETNKKLCINTKYPLIPKLKQNMTGDSQMTASHQCSHQTEARPPPVPLLVHPAVPPPAPPRTPQNDVIWTTNSVTYRDVLLRKPTRAFTQMLRPDSVSSNTLGDSALKPHKPMTITPKLRLKIDKMLTTTDGAFMFICGKCFRGHLPEIKGKHSKVNCCDTPKRHAWESSKVLVHRSPNKAPVLIRTRPKGLFTHIKAKICINRYGCRHGDKCLHAHNPIEIEVWNLGRDLVHEDIMKRCKMSTPASGFCCSYCNMVFQVRWTLDQHVNTQEHKDNITLDKERLWQYREPPANAINGCYEMCASINTSVRCAFSDMIPADNLCPKAHTKEEMEEWLERHAYRRMKIMKARRENIFSFMNDLQTEYRSTDSEIDVICTDTPAGVTINCDNKLTHYMIESASGGMYTYSWTFSVRSPFKTPLESVGLFHDEYRLHFYLSKPNNAVEPQVCPAKDIISKSRKKGHQRYNFSIMFKSKMRGRYEQWVIFDFGCRPVVRRKLVVHTGVKEDDDALSARRQGSHLDQTTGVWDGSNVKIIPYRYQDEETMGMEAKYKLREFHVDIDVDTTDLTKDNYKHMMQHVLRLEEQSQQNQLAKFCLDTEMKVNVTVSIETAGATSSVYAQGGQLFGKIDITQSVFDDSDASQIALSSVHVILIKPNTMSTVYEAQVLLDTVDGRTQDAIYVHLSALFVNDLNLSSGMTISVKIQFRLDRLRFCVLRWAIDQIRNVNVLFPAKNEHPALICPQDTDTTSKLDRLQEGAVRFMREQGGQNSKTPVLLLYGPFGTGKTHTLAQGVMSALEDTDSRILICTHTNSAADLYITEYLSQFVQNWDRRSSTNNSALDMLRVYPPNRDIRTIPDEVRQYMLVRKDGKELDEWDIRGKRIVVTTTSSSLQLASFERLRGYFTHIIIDEAAQVLEAEAIIPLILAIPSTCVVLAGDHMQMGPKVYSKRARDMGFHRSLLERLFDHCLRKKCHRQILLRYNYRTHETILAFLSKVFYSAEELAACGKQCRHPVYYPLEFRAVLGDDMLIGNSYVNSYEVLETANRVQEVLDHWPAESWGPKSQADIGVFTPYRLQVQQLRKELRSRGLSQVFVDSLRGVQGKQFRVVFINTVRTKATINKKKSDPDTEYYLGFLSDIRELNTAFTRAQSLVVVIGNPLALCYIGECCSVWKKYIKECERNGSLYPQDASYKDFRLDISAAAAVLNPRAVSFVPQAHALPEQSSGNEGTDTTGHIRLADDQDSSDDDEVTDFNRDDIILQELRRQMRRDKKRTDGQDDDSSDTETDEETYMTTRISMRMVEEDDHVRVVEGGDDPRGDDINQTAAIQTGQTIPCIFRMNLDGQRLAIPKVSEQISEITIGTHSQRATAMDGDEVLVEILVDEDADKINAEAMTTEPSKVYGKVVSVEKRAVDFTDKKLVCLADPFSDNLMVPVNRRLPKLMILRPAMGGYGKGIQSSGHLIIPVCRLADNTNSFKRAIRERDIVVSNKDRPHKLFVVQWLKWRMKDHYPIGIVINDLPSGDNRNEGLAILKQMYEVQDQKVSKDILQRYPKGWQIPQVEYQKRLDLRELTVFTIDPPESQDLDDALSIEQLTENTYKVGVHIADVSHFVQYGTDTDMKAREMATSFYPAFDSPIHMLPAELSTNMCSLIPYRDRLTLSVFLVFQEDGTVIPTKTTIAQSIVHSQIQLNYDEAEDIIVTDDHDDDDDLYDSEIKESIIALSRLAWNRRQKRIGKARYECPLDCMSHPRAHVLVEEMMLLANETVARYLLSKLPQCTPLRRQLPPPLASFRAWKEDNHERIDQSLHLMHRKEILQAILQDVDQTYDDETPDHVETIRIVRRTWDEIKMCVSRGQPDLHHLGGLLCTDKYHPQLAPIHSALHRILQSGEYINSGGNPPEALEHSGLYMIAYTHFTSPIRRYVDIVVHRLLVATLNKETLPHDEAELAAICHHCNIRCSVAREFESKTHALKLAVELKQEPRQIHAFVEVLSEKSLQVGFSHDYEVSKSTKKCNIAFNLLKPILAPKVQEGDKSLVMTWKERVYHVRGISTMTPHDIRANRLERCTLVVDNSQHMSLEIPTDRWQSINQAMNEERCHELTEQIKAVECTMPSQNDTPTQMVRDVTCETGDAKIENKIYVKFNHQFEVGEVAMLQLYPTFNRGIFSPNVQLFQMTPSLDFCTEHRGKPVQCFSKVADYRPDRKNIGTYKETWLPIIDMVAAYSAVHENETVIIHGVKIEWQHQSKESLPTGSFTLLKKFCDDRNIKIGFVMSSGRKAAYLCIRQSNEHQAMTFVAHAWTWDVKHTEDKKDSAKSTMTVFFEVNQMSTPFSRAIPRNQECTIEIIPLSYPDSRLEGAIQGVGSASTLVRNMCLLKHIDAHCDDETDAESMRILVAEARKISTFIVPGCSLNQLNRPQEEAVKKALTQRFTVIQGPPGTGKTVTGAYLAYFFTKQNEKLPKRNECAPQVLYCGPSNKSVDVIAEYLKRFKIRILRVYSKSIESQEYFVPGQPALTGKLDSKDVTMDSRHESISLHHRIRMSTNSKSEEIRMFDRRFRISDYKPKREEIKAYFKLISRAEMEEFPKFQVILSTCNAGGRSLLASATNVIQCIVDEAGMCNEPETLVPLITNKPLQVVLIGDHKQLRPIIQEPTARLLGMDVSLLERYAQQMSMLTVQYRMHELICQFPSNAFYDGQLITPPTVQRRQSVLPPFVWPGRGPIAFCHCFGQEETISVRTAEGGESSTANLYEVEQVVRMASTLVDHYKIKEENIVILSQYRLQCDRVSKALEACKKNISVRTVVKSQGSEWDYVIMSTVRSLPRVEIEESPNFGWRKKFLGFITDENQMNVALTRARHGLIIVGNKYLLRTHKRWKELLDQYEENKCLVEAKQFLKVRNYRY